MADTELKLKLQNILNEKTTKLIPNNIKKDVTILGVTGALETDHIIEFDSLDNVEVITEDSKNILVLTDSSEGGN